MSDESLSNSGKVSVSASGSESESGSGSETGSESSSDPDLVGDAQQARKGSLKGKHQSVISLLDEAGTSASFDGNSLTWNDRFQELWQHIRQHTPETLLDERMYYNEQLISLSQDFHHAAKTYGKMIISEVYLPLENKTIKPASVGGQAGGDKYIVQDILFKFAVDSHNLFDGDDWAAAKVAGHERKGLVCYFSLGLPDVCVPLMAIVDYRGFRLIAISLLPIHSLSLVYGTNDAGETVYNSSRTFNRFMQRAAKRMRLAPHWCGRRDPKRLWSAADIEGHLGDDNRLYLLDFSRTLPPVRPNAKLVNGHLYCLFRKEFLIGSLRSPDEPSGKTSSLPDSALCSDAYSGFIINDPRNVEHNRAVDRATDFLENDLIPRYTTKALLYYIMEAQTCSKLAEVRIPELMHSKGINMRYLGLVYHHMVQRCQRAEYAPRLVLIEACARVLKTLLRESMRAKMRVFRLPLEAPFRLLVVEFLNRALGFGESSRRFWNERVVPLLLERFHFQREDLDRFLPTRTDGGAKAPGAVGLLDLMDDEEARSLAYHENPQDCLWLSALQHEVFNALEPALPKGGSRPLSESLPAVGSTSAGSMRHSGDNPIADLVERIGLLVRTASVMGVGGEAGGAATVDGGGPGDALSEQRLRAVVHLHREVLSGRRLLKLRLQTMTGLHFSTDFVTLENKKLSWVPAADAPLLLCNKRVVPLLLYDRPFAVLDLEEIGERIKEMNTIQAAHGKFYHWMGLRQAASLHGQSGGGEYADALLSKGITRYEQVLAGDPNDRETLLNCALTCLKLLELRSNAHESTLRPGPVQRDVTARWFSPTDPMVLRADNFFLRLITTFRDHPDSARFLAYYGLFLQRCGRVARAEHHFLRAIERPGYCLPAYLLYGRFLIWRGETKAGSELLQAAASLFPTTGPPPVSPLHGTFFTDILHVVVGTFDPPRYVSVYAPPGITAAKIHERVLRVLCQPRWRSLLAELAPVGSSAPPRSRASSFSTSSSLSAAESSPSPTPGRARPATIAAGTLADLAALPMRATVDVAALPRLRQRRLSDATAERCAAAAPKAKGKESSAAAAPKAKGKESSAAAAPKAKDKANASGGARTPSQLRRVRPELSSSVSPAALRRASAEADTGRRRAGSSEEHHESNTAAAAAAPAPWVPDPRVEKWVIELTRDWLLYQILPNPVTSFGAHGAHGSSGGGEGASIVEPTESRFRPLGLYPRAQRLQEVLVDKACWDPSLSCLAPEEPAEHSDGDAELTQALPPRFGSNWLVLQSPNQSASVGGQGGGHTDTTLSDASSETSMAEDDDLLLSEGASSMDIFQSISELAAVIFPLNYDHLFELLSQHSQHAKQLYPEHHRVALDRIALPAELRDTPCYAQLQRTLCERVDRLLLRELTLAQVVESPSRSEFLPWLVLLCVHSAQMVSMLFTIVRHQCGCERLTVPGSSNAVDDHPLLYVDTAIARHDQVEGLETDIDGPFSPELYLTALVNAWNLLLRSGLLSSCAGTVAHGSKQRHSRRHKLLPSLSLLMGRLLIVMNHLHQRHWHQVTMRLDNLYKLCFSLVLTVVERHGLLPVGQSFDRLPALLPLSTFSFEDLFERRLRGTGSTADGNDDVDDEDEEDGGADGDGDGDGRSSESTQRRRLSSLRRSLRPSALRSSSTKAQYALPDKGQKGARRRKGKAGRAAHTANCTPEMLARIAKATGVRLNEFQAAAVLTTDDGVILAINAQASELLEYHPKELVGQNVTTIMPERYRANHPALMARYRRTRNRRLVGKPRQLEVVTKQGRRIPVVISLGESIIGGKSVFVGQMFRRTDLSDPHFPFTDHAATAATAGSLPSSNTDSDLSFFAVHYRSCVHGRPARHAQSLVEDEDESTLTGTL